MSAIVAGLSSATITTDVSGYVVATFTANGTASLASSAYADVLVVGGGGGGGGATAGGGGAGAVIFYPQLQLAAAAYPVTVGAGGASGVGYSTAAA